MTGSASARPIRLPGGSAQRLFFLDWLRIMAFGVLVIYHVGMYYVTWDFHVKSPNASHALEPWMKLSEPWRMSLLFMVSGAATAFMFKGGATTALLRWRTRHLLLPLLCGMVLIVPPQAYFQVVQKFHYTGDYLDFLGLYFSRYKGFCHSGNCLILPTWNHLWFLPYLWLYTVVLWSAVALWPGRLVGLGIRVDQTLATGRGRLALAVLPVVWLLLLRATLFARYPETHAVIADWFNHALYGSMFVAGAALAMAPRAWALMAQWRWPALAVALCFWAVLVGNRPGAMAQHAVVATFQWSALVAACGWARQWLNRDHPWRQHLTEAVFPVYIFHQTFIIVLSQWLLPLGWSPLLEGPMLVALTLGLSYAGYRLVRPWAPLRPWFGLRPVPGHSHARDPGHLHGQSEKDGNSNGDADVPRSPARGR